MDKPMPEARILEVVPPPRRTHTSGVALYTIISDPPAVDVMVRRQHGHLRTLEATFDVVRGAGLDLGMPNSTGLTP